MRTPVLPQIMLRQSRTRVLEDLYDGLYLQSMLQRCQMRKIRNERDPEGQGLHLPRRVERQRNEWERFLDNICLLCDSHRGGKTTTSVAVEQRSDKVIFCIATRSSSRRDARDYLTKLLHSLRSKCHSGAVDVTKIANAVFENAVKRSPQRVLNYANRLSNAVDELRKKPGLDEEGE